MKKYIELIVHKIIFYIYLNIFKVTLLKLMPTLKKVIFLVVHPTKKLHQPGYSKMDKNPTPNISAIEGNDA